VISQTASIKAVITTAQSAKRGILVKQANKSELPNETRSGKGITAD